MQQPRFHVKKAIDDIKKVLGQNETVSIYEYEVFNHVIGKIEDAFTEGSSHVARISHQINLEVKLLMGMHIKKKMK